MLSHLQGACKDEAGASQPSVAILAQVNLQVQATGSVINMKRPANEPSTVVMKRPAGRSVSEPPGVQSVVRFEKPKDVVPLAELQANSLTRAAYCLEPGCMKAIVDFHEFLDAS